MDQPQLLIRIGAEPASKEEAVKLAIGMLSEAGCVPVEYADSMFRREKTANTYLGNGLAIPHGELADKGMVKKDGLAVLQTPKGVDWGNGNVATLIVAIAAASDAHTDILARLANIVTDNGALAKLNAATDAETVRIALTCDSEPSHSSDSPEEARDLPVAVEWVVDYPAGLHARPATIWVEKANALEIRLQVRNRNKVADPRNMVSLLRLGVREGDTLVFSADGPDAEKELDEFRRAAASLSAGEKAQAARAASRRSAVSIRAWIPPKETVDTATALLVEGVPASPGLTIGTVYRLEPAVIDVPDDPQPLLEGGARLEEAMEKTKLQLAAVVDDTARRLGEADAAIFKAQATLLDDAELIAETCRLLVDGHGVAWSWKEAVERQANELAEVGNPVMAARATDLRDVGLRVLTQLAPDLHWGNKFLPPQTNAIIVAEDLTPSDTATLDTDKVVGLATALGGPTSHTAILARTLGLAAVVAAGSGLLQAENGSKVILDGDGGRIWLNPTHEIVAAAEQEIAKRAIDREAQAKRRALPAITRDNRKVEVAGNVNTPEQAALALEMGAEGVGLMRTEFLFLERGQTPNEDEQFEIYRDMAAALDGRRLIVRCLDIGGDKQVPHLNLPNESNPFLGVRGARLLVRRTDLFEPQLRALYRAAKERESICIMFPMVTSAAEIIEIKEMCDR
ncbi:MAG: PTS sugar transporter subunit IIA, partial [Planctomycetes bacterium]|nr:PTS sugar transporter subunit IIA [Planctomycetota bacterium]